MQKTEEAEWLLIIEVVKVGKKTKKLCLLFSSVGQTEDESGIK